MAKSKSKKTTSKKKVTSKPKRSTSLNKNTNSKKDKKPFKLKEYIKNHPHNDKVVNELKTKIKEYIKSFYKDSDKAKYNHWYAGVSRNPKTDRTNSHKSTKKIAELKYFKPFYARSLSNARKIEEGLCEDFELKKCKVIGVLKKDSNKVYVYNQKASPKKVK